MSDTTIAPTVVFVHGVGMSPSLFDNVIDALPRPSTAWTRPGYDGTEPSPLWSAQVDRLLEVCAHLGQCVLVGVSGGATLALAALLRSSQHIRGVVAHEPLVGDLEPVLHQRVQAAVRALAADPGSESAAVGFAASLYGPDVWKAIPAGARQWAHRHAATICADVPQFAEFAPTEAELVAISDRLVTTVGACSPDERQRVHSLLIGCGATSRVVEGAGHLVNFEAPHAYAALLDDVIESVFAT